MKKRTYPFEQFTAVRRTHGLAFSPDGREVAYVTNTSGQFNVWKQSVEGGWPWQLTAFEEETVRSLAWAPDGRRFIFTADRHGTEFHQIYELEYPGGWPKQLTDAPNVQHNFSPHGLSPDGRAIVYACNERSPADMDALWRDLASGEVRALMAGGGNFFPVSFSPDGRYVMIVEVRANTDTDLWLYNLNAQKGEKLTPHPEDEEIVFWPGPWRPDSKAFYVITDKGREFKGLALYDLEERSLGWVETPDWDVEGVALSRDGRYLAWVVNEDGYSRLCVRDLETGEPLDLSELPRGVIPSVGGPEFSPDGRLLAFYFANARRPLDLYVLDLESRELRRLTYSHIGNVPEEEMVEPELVRIPSFDREIPAWLYKPQGLKEGERVPVVLSIHGGPEAQERPGYNYSGLYQYLLNRGIGVLAPNIRGSTGYGKTYQRLIHRDWGGGELKDLEACAKYLQSLDWVDSKRLGVFGGSFGGFATLSCATRLPDYWAAAVDIVGPSNLVTFAKAVPPFWKRYMKKWVGDPEEDYELLMERSPITYVEQLKCPILIIQGANDPRVVKAESDQMVEKLRALGREVEYWVFEDEGHGFTKRKNELRAWRATAEFFEKQLL